MTERRDEVNDIPLLPSAEPALRVPVTDEDLADAITRLVGRYAKELAASGMSASEAEETAMEWIAEAVGLPREEIRRQAAGTLGPSIRLP